MEMEADFEGALHDVPEDPAGDDAESEEGDDERLQQVLELLHTSYLRHTSADIPQSHHGRATVGMNTICAYVMKVHNVAAAS